MQIQICVCTCVLQPLPWQSYTGETLNLLLYFALYILPEAISSNEQRSWECQHADAWMRPSAAAAVSLVEKSCRRDNLMFVMVEWLIVIRDE